MLLNRNKLHNCKTPRRIPFIVRSCKQPQPQQPDKFKKIDIALYTFASMSVLCSSIVMLAVTWQSEKELERLKTEYKNTHDQIQIIQKKQMTDEIMIEAIIGNVLELRDIGVL